MWRPSIHTIVTRFLAKYGTSSPVGAQLCVIAARAEREDSIVVARWVCAVAARSQKVGKCGMFYTDKRRVSPPQGIVRLAQAVKCRRSQINCEYKPGAEKGLVLK